MDENSDLTALTEAEEPLLPTALIYVVTDPLVAPKPRKVPLARALAIVTGAGLFGAPVDKAIASGAIALTADEHFVALTGQADTDDELTAINKTGGGYLDHGHVVVLTGAVGLAHVITLVDTANFKLQSLFSINNEYDAITLIQRSDGVWQEMTRANNG